MIRQGTEKDIPACIEMGRQFVEAGGWKCDDDSLRQTFIELIAQDGLLVAGEPAIGMIGVMVFRNYMFRSENVAQELFWWVNPSSRQRGIAMALLKAAEDLAMDRGAKSLSMLCMESLSPDRVELLYRRNGYKPSERSFMKVL